MNRILMTLLFIFGISLTWISYLIFHEMAVARWYNRMGAETKSAQVIAVTECTREQPRIRGQGVHSLFLVYPQVIQARVLKSDETIEISGLRTCLNVKPDDEIFVVNVGLNGEGKPRWRLPETEINFGLNFWMTLAMLLAGLSAISLSLKRWKRSSTPAAGP